MGINDEKIGEPELSEPTFKNMVTIKLTAYDCHRLMRCLDNQLRICNIEQKDNIAIYENICSQIHNKNFCVTGSEKHRRLDPEYFKKLEEEELEKIAQENIRKNNEARERQNSVSWWGKLFGKA